MRLRVVVSPVRTLVALTLTDGDPVAFLSTTIRGNVSVITAGVPGLSLINTSPDENCGGMSKPSTAAVLNPTPGGAIAGEPEKPSPRRAKQRQVNYSFAPAVVVRAASSIASRASTKVGERGVAFKPFITNCSAAGLPLSNPYR